MDWCDIIDIERYGDLMNRNEARAKTIDILLRDQNANADFPILLRVFGSLIFLRSTAAKKF